MSQEGPHRRRRKPALDGELEQQARGERKPDANPETIKIVLTHDEDTPDWMVSAQDVSGAASRRTKTERRESKPARQSDTHEENAPVKKEAQQEQSGQQGGQQGRQQSGQRSRQQSGPQSGQQSGQKKPQRSTAARSAGAKMKKTAGKGRRAGLSAKERRRRAQRMKKNAAWALLCTVALMLIVVGAMGGARLLDIKQTLDRGDGVFYANMFVNDIPLEGKTLTQAADAVTAQVANLLANWKITLRTQDGRSWDITGDDLKMQYNVADQLDQLWAIGHAGSSQMRYEAVKALEQEPIKRYTTLTYDMTAISQIITQIKNEVDRAPVNATRVLDETYWPPYTYTDDVPGLELDVSGLNEKIQGMVDRLESGVVELVPTTVQASVTRQYLEGQIVKLATFETSIGKTGDYVESRHENIRIGTQRFDRKIIKSGENVSFNKVAGKREDPKNGYWPALEIAYGEYVEGIGGGICQVSSTLYNAVANAGLEIVKRTPHAIPSSYVDMGLDATVSDDRYDFVFKNSTEAEIFISADYYKGKDNYWRSRFTIYGRPDPNGYTYKLESKVVQELPLPEPEYRLDKEGTYVIYDDEQYEASKGRKGYVVEVYKVTRDAKGLEVARELLYTDTYKPAAPRIYVGVTPRATPEPTMPID